MSSRTTTLIALLACACIACESYDPPPEVTLVVSQTGTWALDAPLELTFSEPIKSETLKISIWPFELDEEGEIATDVVPLVDSCTLGGDSCGDLGLTLGADASSAELDLSVLFADRQGEPYILEVHEGLTDSGGKVRITRSRFDFQVSPSSGSGPVVAELNSGVMLQTINLSRCSSHSRIQLNLFRIVELFGRFLSLRTWLQSRLVPVFPVSTWRLRMNSQTH